MKKLSIIFLILSLILFTALIKNSTKRIDDEIFTKEENIRSLQKDFENVKLEHDYLSSAEKLITFQNVYFNNELVGKDIEEIKKIKQNLKNLETESLKFINE